MEEKASETTNEFLYKCFIESLAKFTILCFMEKKEKNPESNE